MTPTDDAALRELLEWLRQPQHLAPRSIRDISAPRWADAIARVLREREESGVRMSELEKCGKLGLDTMDRRCSSCGADQAFRLFPTVFEDRTALDMRICDACHDKLMDGLQQKIVGCPECGANRLMPVRERERGFELEHPTWLSVSAARPDTRSDARGETVGEERRADPAAAEAVRIAGVLYPKPATPPSATELEERELLVRALRSDRPGHYNAMRRAAADEIERLAADRARLAAEVDTQIDKRLTVERERDEARKEVDELRLVLANDPGENAVLLRAIDYWRREYDRVDDMRSKLAVEVTEARAEVERLRKLIKMANDTNATALDRISAIEAENTALRLRVEELEQHLRIWDEPGKLEVLCLRVAEAVFRYCFDDVDPNDADREDLTALVARVLEQK